MSLVTISTIICIASALICGLCLLGIAGLCKRVMGEVRQLTEAMKDDL